MREQQTRRVAIVVLDEIGQSPRMQLHARALVDRGIPVDIICYAGDVTPEWVRNHPLIFLWPLPAPGWTGRHRLPRALFSLYTVFRGARITINLFWTLMFGISPPNFFLIQTPPPVPTLPLCLLAAKIRGAATIIDWHNYGHSILALRLGERHWMVRLTLWVERVFSRQATHHLCVSRAMQADLATRWGISDAWVLYDRPPEQFTEAGDDRRDRLLEALSGLIPEDMAQACASSSEDRPAILVSPTSWTMDEDFTLLLDALEECDAAIAQQEEDEEDDSVFPYLVVFLTGNGPMRRRYERRIASLKLRLITVCTGWLSDEDYAVLLGAADLGLCMHTSSSGVDLPMKIAEMQGAKLPTCAFDYGDCLAEMVEPGETGLLFRDSATLAQQIRDLFRDFPGGAVQLRSMREALRNRSRPRWSEEWDGVAAGLLGLGPRPD